MDVDGSLTVHTGPMFSGKTTALLSTASGRDALLFTPERDDRYADAAVVTHDGQRMEARVVPEAGFAPIVYAADPDLVCVDEANFFDAGLVDTMTELRDMGYTCHVAGLDRDFTGVGFAPVPALIEAADTVERLTAECAVCGADATRTQRLHDGVPAPVDGPQVQVGGAETYEPRCMDHHRV